VVGVGAESGAGPPVLGWCWERRARSARLRGGDFVGEGVGLRAGRVRILDEFYELHEDPDLDRYLADPAGFVRV